MMLENLDQQHPISSNNHIDKARKRWQYNGMLHATKTTFKCQHVPHPPISCGSVCFLLCSFSTSNMMILLELKIQFTFIVAQKKIETVAQFIVLNVAVCVGVSMCGDFVWVWWSKCSCCVCRLKYYHIEARKTMDWNTECWKLLEGNRRRQALPQFNDIHTAEKR